MVDTVLLHLNGYHDLFRCCQVVGIPGCRNIDLQFVRAFLKAFLDCDVSVFSVYLEVLLELLLVDLCQFEL